MKRFDTTKQRYTASQLSINMFELQSNFLSATIGLVPQNGQLLRTSSIKTENMSCQCPPKPVVSPTSLCIGVSVQLVAKLAPSVELYWHITELLCVCRSDCSPFLLIQLLPKLAPIAKRLVSAAPCCTGRRGDSHCAFKLGHIYHILDFLDG